MSMSSESEVDDFFDAVDESPAAKIGSGGSRKQSVTAQGSSDSLDDTSGSTSPSKSTDASAGASGAELEARRRKLRRLRNCVTGEEEAPEPPSPHGSQSGSADGVVSRSSHPFRKVEHDAQSMVSQMSLGKVGRILAGVDDLDGAAASRSSVTELASAAAAAKAEAETARMPPPPPPPPPPQPPPPRPEPPHTRQPEPAPAPAVAAGVVAEYATTSAAGVGEYPSAVATAVGEYPSAVATGVGEYPPPALPVPDLVSSVARPEVAPPPPPPPPPVAPPRRRRRRPTPVAADEPRATTSPAGRRGLPPEHSPAVGRRGLPPDQVPAERRRGLPPEQSPRERRRGLPVTPEREHEHSLDIRSATKGQYVVKPQDEESARAPWVQAMDHLDVISVQSDASSITDSISPYQHHSDNMQRLDQVKEAQEFLRSHEIQTNIFVKTKTDSGRPLTDKEILDQVSVLNLDTGERIPLSVAEEKLPACINPLSLQIMRMTSEYISNSSLEKDGSDDDKKLLVIPPEEEHSEPGSVRRKTAQLKRFMSRTVNKARDRAEVIAQKMAQVRHREERDAFESIDGVPDAHTVVRVPMKASGSHKGPYEFDQLLFVQDFKGEHIGPVWCMKFSACGRLLATAGQDHVLRVWVLKSAYHYFMDMRTKYSAEKVSPTPSQESLVSQHSSEEALLCTEAVCEEEAYAPFVPRPFCKYTGHTADLLDISWSKNYFILSSSMDKTVRLWHISRKECLCCFQHIEFVTAIAFHPKDDRYFLSGSLDGKLRLWNIPDKKVALWNELDGQGKLITAANFCQGGRFAVVGSYDGRCLFYSTDQLKYHTQIHVRSTRGKNARGRKISGIEPMPGEDKILITSNDSRVRLYDLRDLNLSCKYKGFTNNSSQIRASFSHDGKHIVAGSENQCVYIWKTHHDYSKFSSARRDRNDFWEGIKAHEAQVTCALFAPHPDLVFSHVDAELLRLEQEGGERASQGSASMDAPAAGPAPAPATPRSDEAKKDSLDKKSVGSGGTSTMGYVLVTADFNGCIKVFLNRTRPKHSSLPASALLRETPLPAAGSRGSEAR